MKGFPAPLSFPNNKPLFISPIFKFKFSNFTSSEFIKKLVFINGLFVFVLKDIVEASKTSNKKFCMFIDLV